MDVLSNLQSNVATHMLTSFPPETRTLVENVQWATYVSLSEDRRGSVPRITFDRGLMELMSPKKEHEVIKTLIGRLIAAYAEAKEIDLLSVASTTFRREDLERGFEADEAFYVVHADAMRMKEEIDLQIDPAPELVIEVEMTSSAIRKLELFAALGVAEVWRHNGDEIKVFRLTSEGYQSVDASGVLAGFPIAEATAIIRRRRNESEVKLVRKFRDSFERCEG